MSPPPTLADCGPRYFHGARLFILTTARGKKSVTAVGSTPPVWPFQSTPAASQLREAFFAKPRNEGGTETHRDRQRIREIERWRWRRMSVRIRVWEAADHCRYAYLLIGAASDKLCRPMRTADGDGGRTQAMVVEDLLVDASTKLVVAVSVMICIQ
jgi:hypothetical protein